VREHPIYDWLRRRPYVLDVGIAGVLALWGFGTGSVLGSFPAGLVLIALFSVPLVFRRTYPVASFTAVSLACVVQLILTDTWIPLDVAFLLSLYAVSANSTKQWARIGALGVGALGAVLGSLDWIGVTGSFLFSVGIMGALVAFTWTLGDLLRTRRAYVGQLEERARRLEIERDQQAQIARAAERARIARELHDVVAHSLSVVIAQADGGLYAGSSDPGAARESLATIGATGRQALTEMRRLLGVLRHDGDSTAMAPQPSLSQVEELVGNLRGGGLAVSLEISGTPRPLPGGAELAAYRIVQEALTNTLKHAGPGAKARVCLAYEPSLLRVSVSDDGRGAAAADDGRGQGILGMRERVALYNGTFTAGPRVGGGFQVVAELSLPAGGEKS
jgi:signal transduction histidine kinase